MMDLVIQGSDVDTIDLKRIAKAARAGAIEQTSAGVFRLKACVPAAEVAALCEAAHVDCGYVPAHRKLADYRLLVMDMDSTLITVETIDELADMVGLKEPVAAITAQAMRGEIEYKESLRRRVAVLKGLDERALERVYAERVKLTPGAERLIGAVQSVGMKTLLVSGGFTRVSERLKSRLKLDYARANTLEIEHGKLTGNFVGEIVDAAGKRDALIEVRDTLGLAREQIIGIGDGANDLAFMAECGVSVAFRAKPVVRAQASHALDYSGLDGVLNLFMRDEE
jgi:phosphoserine phosphatase